MLQRFRVNLATSIDSHQCTRRCVLLFHFHILCIMSYQHRPIVKERAAEKVGGHITTVGSRLSSPSGALLMYTTTNSTGERLGPYPSPPRTVLFPSSGAPALTMCSYCSSSWVHQEGKLVICANEVTPDVASGLPCCKVGGLRGEYKGLIQHRLRRTNAAASKCMVRPSLRQG